MTAQEAIAKCEADPTYRAMRADKDRQIAEREEQYRREVKPLLDDLATIGVVVESVPDLCCIPAPDERVFPILMEHLKRPYSAAMLEWIGRACGAKNARPIVWDTLVSMLKTHSLEERAADGVMVSISEIAQPRDLQTLIDLLSDRSLGGRRIFLVENLMRSRKPEARDTLLRLQDDPDLTKEITDRLARSRSGR